MQMRLHRWLEKGYGFVRQALIHEIELTKIRYRYRPYYALSIFGVNILLRAGLLLLPLFILLAPLLDSSRRPKIQNLATHTDNLIINPDIKTSKPLQAIYR